MKARYVHTSLVASDWRRLSQFYIDVFSCLPVPPERDLSGTWLAEATHVPDAHIRGIHLKLPGYGDAGPSLEIFQYEHNLESQPSVPNRHGLAHLAFEVDDVEAALQQVLDAGGGVVGAVVSHDIPGAGALTFCYCTDPEGNILELQHWAGRPVL
jgi:predicted enzyme related to lactoylglutathione lyase